VEVTFYWRREAKKGLLLKIVKASLQSPIAVGITVATLYVVMNLLFAWLYRIPYDGFG
jgi:hypothetical protein